MSTNRKTSGKEVHRKPLKPSNTEMVTQPVVPKTSDTFKKDKRYEARCLLHFFGKGHAVETVEVHGDVIQGTVSRQSRDERSWPEPPHLALANLRTLDAIGKPNMQPELGLRLDEQAVEKFVQQYGPLFEKDIPKGAIPPYGDDVPNLHFQEQLAEFASAQKLLRESWGGSMQDIADIEASMQKGFQVNMRRRAELFVGTGELWKFICLLYLLDVYRQKAGFCGNPDCAAPYFIKKRRTQIFCEAGPCTAYAARQYTKRWWESGGKKLRIERQAKRMKKKRNNR